MSKIALNAGNPALCPNSFVRASLSLLSLAGAGLFAPVVLADEGQPVGPAAPTASAATTTSVAPTTSAATTTTAPPRTDATAPNEGGSTASPGTAKPPTSGAVAPSAGAPAVKAAASGSTLPTTTASQATAPNPASSPPTKTGVPAEAGLPGWLLTPSPSTSALEWHGNIELDGGYVRYSWNQSSQRPESVHDSRGRFVLGPMLTHDLGNGNFLRVTGQVVAWVREDYNFYQINADDVYAQIGKKGVWDVMAGRFLTWRVFRKGLGFDLYTLEDTGARTKPNFADQSGWYSHMYEVNTIFMRDSFGSTPVPAGRVALHYYPSSCSGIELVGSYGRLQSGGNVAGGRIAAGIQQKYFNALGGAEYEHWAPPQQIGGPDPATGSFIACEKCGVANAYGAGGSAALTLNPVEFVLDAAYRKFDSWNGQVTSVLTSSKTTSFGGYLQFDAGSVVIQRSLIVGGGLFRTEFLDNDKLFQRHWQAAGYIAYPLGFNNAVVKLVLSKATGYQTHRDDPVLDSDMYSLRLRFAFYY